MCMYFDLHLALNQKKEKMEHSISKLLLTSALTLGLTNPATALDFTFSWGQQPGQFGVQGTVQGRIAGLTDNSTSVPTGVFVEAVFFGSPEGPSGIYV